MRQISYQKPIDASRSKAGVAISPFLSLRAFCSAEGVAISSLCHCTPAKGESGNLIFFPPFCHCEGSQGSLWQSRLLKKHKNIDCFVASLLAMTTRGTIIARPPKARVAISYFFPPFCHCEGSQGSPWQSRLLKKHKNIDCFVASLLAMTAL